MWLVIATTAQVPQVVSPLASVLCIGFLLISGLHRS